MKSKQNTEAVPLFRSVPKHKKVETVMSEYQERDIEQLDDAGNHYSKHINAMTAENLNSKSAIAAELAYRDNLIQKMEFALKLYAEEVRAPVNHFDKHNTTQG